MGTTTSGMDCPYCGSDAYSEELNYKTGEYHNYCTQCGYVDSYYYKRDDEGMVIKKDYSKGFEHDNFVVVHNIVKKPYAASCIIYDRGIFQLGTIKTKKQHDKFVRLFKNPDNLIEDIQHISTSHFDPKLLTYTKITVYEKVDH